MSFTLRLYGSTVAGWNSIHDWFNAKNTLILPDEVYFLGTWNPEKFLLFRFLPAVGDYFSYSPSM